MLLRYFAFVIMYVGSSMPDLGVFVTVFVNGFWHGIS